MVIKSFAINEIRIVLDIPTQEKYEYNLYHACRNKVFSEKKKVLTVAYLFSIKCHCIVLNIINYTTANRCAGSTNLVFIIDYKLL